MGNGTWGGGGGGGGAPRVFLHGINVVDGGIKVLFFGVFLLFFGIVSHCPPFPGRGLIVLFFVPFCYFRSSFSLPPLEKFFLSTSLLVTC